MTDRLKVYNGALLICGQRALSALTETVEARRLLDEVWNDNGVRYCLEQGQWRFAMRSSRLSYETAVEPAFGYRRAFAKPTDWARTAAVCEDEYFRTPLVRYSDEDHYLFADLDEIYVRYVSDDDTYGSDLGKWPPSFTEYVKTYFASRIILKLTDDVKRQERILGRTVDGRDGLLGRALLIAKNNDAVSDPTKFAAQGAWSMSRSRYRRGGAFEDGGSSSNLIG